MKPSLTPEQSAAFFAMLAWVADVGSLTSSQIVLYRGGRRLVRRTLNIHRICGKPSAALLHPALMIPAGGQPGL
jgi:hypothetical protein